MTDDSIEMIEKIRPAVSSAFTYSIKSQLDLRLDWPQSLMSFL